MTTPTTAPKKPLPPLPTQKKKPPAPPPQWAKPNIGLATPSTTKTEKEGETGGWASSKTKDSYTHDEQGKVNGTQTKNTSTAGTGAKGSITSKSDVFDGTTHTGHETSAEGLAGAEAAVEMLAKHSDEEIKAAIKVMARAGAFGEVKGKSSVRRGIASASAEGSASGGAGVQADGEASAKIDRSGLIPAIELVVNASLKAGVWGEASAKLQAAVGPLTASLVLKIEAWAGAQASFDAKAWAKWNEVGASFKASAKAGAGSEGSATAELTLGSAALEVTTGYDVFAGVAAEAKGKFKVSTSGVSAKFKASAIAGARAEVSGKAKLKVRGKTIVSAKGKVSVMAGAGVELEGEFTIESGKLKIGGGLGGALKGGAGASGTLMIDFYALADVIVAEVKDYARQEELQIKDAAPAYKREPLTDPAQIKKKIQFGYDTVIDDFRAYNAKKMKGGEHGIKKEQVQAIIQNRAGQLHAEFAFTETDRGIEQAAHEAFGPLLKSFVVQAGYIRGFDVVKDTATVQGAKEKYQRDQKWRAARDGLADELTKYGDKKATVGKSGVKLENIQKIVTNRWKGIKEAFPDTGVADDVVRFAIEKSLGDYVTSFDVSDGKLSNFVAPEDKATKIKQDAKDDAGAAARTTAVGLLKGKLAAYKSGVISNPKKNLDKTEVAKLVTASTSKIKDQLAKPETDTAIASAIVSALDPLVEASGVVVERGVLKELTAKTGGLAEARQAKKSGDEKDARGAAIHNLGTSLAGYLESKTKGGANGVKSVEVQKRVDKATEKVRDWVLTGDADEQIKQSILDNLKTMVTDAGVTKGVVTITAPQLLAASVKKDRKDNGKAKLGGDEDDNTRRRMVSDAVRSEFVSYASQVRSSAESAKGGTAPKVKLEKPKLQSIIDKKTKVIRADVVNQVGDEAVVTAAQDVFGPMLKKITVSKLKVDELEPETDITKFTKARDNESARVRTAVADLQADLKTYAQNCDKFGRMPDKSVVQGMVDKHKAKFNGMDEDEADLAMTMAVNNAFRDRIKSVKIHNATVHFFLVSVVPTGTH